MARAQLVVRFVTAAVVVALLVVAYAVDRWSGVVLTVLGFLAGIANAVARIAAGLVVVPVWRRAP